MENFEFCFAAQVIQIPFYEKEIENELNWQAANAFVGSSDQIALDELFTRRLRPAEEYGVSHFFFDVWYIASR